jgi:hypothetical protein
MDDLGSFRGGHRLSPKALDPVAQFHRQAGRTVGSFAARLLAASRSARLSHLILDFYSFSPVGFAPSHPCV